MEGSAGPPPRWVAPPLGQAEYTRQRPNAALMSGKPGKQTSHHATGRRVQRGPSPGPSAWLSGLKACVAVAVLGILTLASPSMCSGLQSSWKLEPRAPPTDVQTVGAAGRSGVGRVRLTVVRL